MSQIHDIDPVETQEWLDSLASVLEHDGPERARFLLEALRRQAERIGAAPSTGIGTPYINTIAADREPQPPGDGELEERLLAILRWNAIVAVVRANRDYSGVGGHIASYASVAHLFEMGFNHFWKAPTDEHRGDLVYLQGHSSPGVYSRAFLEGRVTRDQMLAFRREVAGAGADTPSGLSSYPHPWLMPDFWQFATVSMGLGPLAAIYQARFLKYLQNRGLLASEHNTQRRVWCFIGDGESSEPETLGCLNVAANEKLDNLVFVLNCNLQRLDGPVRGNGKILQEMEGIFRGAGWNVLKVVWSSAWDDLLARDSSGQLLERLNAIVDGEYQNVSAKDGAYMREHLFNTPELRQLVAHLSNEELKQQLIPGGHDRRKIYAAYRAAIEHGAGHGERGSGQPTVILAHTVKGFGLGTAAEGLNISHQQKKMKEEELEAFRERFQLQLTREHVRDLEFFVPDADSPEMQYLHARRKELGGYLPTRVHQAPQLPVPELDTFQVLLDGTGEDREMSTTMAFVRVLTILARDKRLKEHLVPIVADEARTFGMEGLFRQIGIYAPEGQKYTPVDADQLMFYKESQDGQLLQEGINEAGAFTSWLTAATSYANHGVPMIPFYIYYSMFGFQRIGDLAWLAGDQRARGFLLGATAGRTTLNGEGLQHEDGHSHLLAATYPACRAYDPTFAYEVAVILLDGLRRMLVEQEDGFYYLTVMNENYPQPAMPEGAEEGILRGLYRLRTATPAPAKGSKKGKSPSIKTRKAPRVQLLGSGTILREVQAAAEILEERYGVLADVWSATSFNQLRRDGEDVDRWNRLHPEQEPRQTWVEQQLGAQLAETPGPVIASTDYQRLFAEQIRPWVPTRYVTLGTDGFGRSDTREALRDFFEVDRRFVVQAALKALADDGQLNAADVTQAMKDLDIDPDRPNPMLT